MIEGFKFYSVANGWLLIKWVRIIVVIGPQRNINLLLWQLNTSIGCISVYINQTVMKMICA